MSAPPALAAVVRAGGPATARVLERVEVRLGELASEADARLAAHATATVAAGGKRVRPLLVALAAGVPPPEEPGLVRAAVAVELIHSATLVHDDVLDDSALRRGRPTVFAAAGRRVATAVGDLLFSRAFAELAGPADLGGAEREAAEASVAVLALASRELAAGELMQREDAYATRVEEARYLERCRLKTGALFRAACELGALQGGGPREELGRFGEEVGVAFQILDDVLDVAGTPGDTGKPRGADLLDGTVNLPLILARRRDPLLAGEELRGLADPAAAAVLCERIERTGALEEARLRAQELVAAAKSRAGALPRDQRRALELAADGVVERFS